MRRNIEVKVLLRHSPGVIIKLVEGLEISLDCCICQRTKRTFWIRFNESGRCNPEKHSTTAVILDSKIEEKEGNTELYYRIEYDYESFVEKKYGVLSQGGSEWARPHFLVQCFICGQQIETDTQSNIVRPYKKSCSCGNILFESLTAPEVKDVT